MIITPEILIKNIVNKMKLYMECNSLTVTGMAKEFDFDYQAFYRMMKGSHSTSLESLCKIAEKMNYSFSDFVSEYVHLEIPIKENDGSFPDALQIKVHFKFEKIYPYCKNKFFANIIKNKFVIYYETNLFELKGKYLAKLSDNTIQELDIETKTNETYFILKENRLIKTTEICQILAKKFAEADFKYYSNFQPDLYCELIL